MQGRTPGREKCPKCGYSLDPGDAECPACGVVLARFRDEPPTAAEPDGYGPDDVGAAFWRPGGYGVADGSASVAEAAELVSLPRPLRWLAVLHTASGVLCALIAVGSFYASLTHPEFLSSAVVNGLLAPVYFWVGWAIRRKHPAGRVLLIIGAFFGLIAIPVGTILSILLLIYLFHGGMPVLFSQKEPQDLSPEEIDLLRGVHGSQAGLWFVRITAFLLIVGAVGIVAAIGFGGFSAFRYSFRGVKAESDMIAIDYAVRDYAILANRYPPTQPIDDLMRTLEQPIPTRDPWGRPYRYASSGFGTFWVGSAGPDGDWTRRQLSGYDDAGPVGDDIVMERGRVLGGG